jgi:hypothetical protein
MERHPELKKGLFANYLCAGANQDLFPYADTMAMTLAVAAVLGTSKPP